MSHLRRSVRWTLAVLAALVALPATASAAGPPTVTTSSVDSSLLTDTYALIGGVVNPNGTATNYQFEWGTTTAYGQITPATAAGNGTAEVPVDFSLDALEPLTTYHFRLVATPVNGDASSRVVGADQAFTTTRALALTVPGHTAKVGKDHKASVRLKVVGPPDTDGRGHRDHQGRHRQEGADDRACARTASIRARPRRLAVTLPASIRKVLAAKGHPKVVLRVLAKTSGIKKPVVKNLKVAG